MQYEPDIVYEDNHILVVIKPHNIAVQADDSGDMDLLTMYKEYIKQRDNKAGNVYLGLVHRLDRPTGGVMVFAKTSKSASRLSALMREKKIYKKYLCVVKGECNKNNINLKTYLIKNEKTNTVSIATQTAYGAKYAELTYDSISSHNGVSLLSVQLHTGRSHQIRVQMASQNLTPIIGDAKYSTEQHKCNLALWSYNLIFEHPVQKKTMNFTILPPSDVAPWHIFSDEINKI